MGAGEGRSLRKLEGGWLGPAHIEERPGGAHVVVRSIRSGFLKDPQARSRLSALAAAQKQPTDPGLVAVLACMQQVGGDVVWETPLVEGEDLAAYIKRQPAMAAKNSAWIGHEIARLLAVGAAAGYCHLALRPSQVLIAANPSTASGLSVCLLGLGLMQALGWQRPLHVPPAQRIFLAPEQTTSAVTRIDERTDVYALGVLLLQLLQGEKPDPRDVNRARANASPLLLPNMMRPETATLISRTLLPDVAQRPRLQEVVQALRLESLAPHRSTTPVPETTAAGPMTAQGARGPAAFAPAPQFVATLPPLPEDAAQQPTPERTPVAANAYTPTLAPDDDVDEYNATGVDGAAWLVASRTMPAAPAQAVKSSLQHAGLLYGNFRIVRRIGRGGMGVVYEAEHRQIGRRAAVKILHPSFATRPDYAARFLNEARAVNIVRHPGLVEIFEYGQQTDGTLYIVMEFLEGESLRALQQKQPDLYPIRRVLGWSLQIARALCATHEKGIIHRDLKPENIMVIPDPLRPGQDWVKLLDFGIAKVGGLSFDHGHVDGTKAATGATPSETAAGATMGTPVYMAPEQDSSAATVDGMADVFSFGVMLYELIAGRRPYKETWSGLRTTPAESLSTLRAGTPAELSTLVLHMLALAPSERPTMAEVLARLAQVTEKLDAEEQAAPRAAREPQPPQPPLPAQAQRRRTPLVLAVSGVLGILIALSAVLGYRMLRLPTLAQARERALVLLKRSLTSSESSEELQAVRALGKSRDHDYRPLLEPLLGTAQPAVVAAAARGLADLSAIESQGALLAVLDNAQDPVVRIEAASALAQLSHPKGSDALRAILQNGDAATQAEAALRLLEIGDRSGAALLHKRMEQTAPGASASGSEDRRLPVLASLARAGDPQARQQLAQLFQAAQAAGKVDPLLAFSLAQQGEPTAHRELVRLASQSGEDRLMAARLLSALGQLDGYAVLLSVGTDENVPERLREVAFDGLGDSGQTPAAGMLARTLEEAAVTPRFRLSAAGAILQIAGGTARSGASRSMSWARAALASDSSATRELAVMLLGDLESDEAIPALRQALKDKDRDVRGGAAHALGRKTVAAALDALSDALDDADEEVRIAGMRSIGKVATALQKSGARDFATNVLARLRQLSEKGTAIDRIVAAGMLLLLGERQQIDILRQGLRAADALARRLAVELLDADRSLLLPALKDPDPQVRFASARRLAELGLGDGIAVLRAALTQGGPDGLLAYSLLRKLGEAVDPPSDLLNLFTGQALREKQALLSLVPDLPLNIALDLLLRSSVDASNALRRRSAEVAFDMFLHTLQNAFHQVLFGLRNDRDAVVRWRVAELIASLPASAKANNQPDADRLAPYSSLLKQSGEPVRATAEKTPDKAAGTSAANAGIHPAAPAPMVLPTPSKLTKRASKSAADAVRTGTKGSLANDPRAKTMGLIQVFVMKKGRCQLTQQYFLPPGDHIVNLAGGASQTVSVYAGSVIPVRQCP